MSKQEQYMSDYRQKVNPRRDRLKQLRAFCQAARFGSVSRAAERVMASQPAVSTQIRMLEEEIGRSIARFGDQAEAFRSMYDNEGMRQNLRNELQTRAVMERIASIARGEMADEDSPEADAEGEAS